MRKKKEEFLEIISNMNYQLYKIKNAIINDEDLPEDFEEYLDHGY